MEVIIREGSFRAIFQKPQVQIAQFSVLLGQLLVSIGRESSAIKKT